MFGSFHAGLGGALTAVPRPQRPMCTMRKALLYCLSRDQRVAAVTCESGLFSRSGLSLPHSLVSRPSSYHVIKYCARAASYHKVNITATRLKRPTTPLHLLDSSHCHTITALPPPHLQHHSHLSKPLCCSSLCSPSSST